MCSIVCMFAANHSIDIFLPKLELRYLHLHNSQIVNFLCGKSKPEIVLFWSDINDIFLGYNLTRLN